MKRFFLLASALAIMVAVHGQKTEYKFDFTGGAEAKGYTRIKAGDKFIGSKGFGFDFGTDGVLRDISAGGKGASGNRGVTGNSPFYFSMQVPEGNYKVEVTLGKSGEGDISTIKAESRRLMMQSIKIKPGSFRTVSFIINIKSPQINATTKVGLKPREYDKLDWDDKLTLEFDGGTILSAMKVRKADDQITVFLAGNSTVVNQDYEPWASWGQMIPRSFKPGVAISNHAESGLTLGSFLSSRRLDKVLSVAKPGDYLFIEFGHNDQKEKGPNDGPWKSYTERFKLFISRAKAKGMIPVVVTSTARRNFDSTGKIVNNLGEYPEAARRVASEEGIALIDLNAMSSKLYEALGIEPSKKAFVFYPANTFPDQKEELHDNTHFNTYGAYELSRCIVEGIRSTKLPIAKFLSDDLPGFNPSHPDTIESFNWPQSPRISPVKPDGN